MADPRYSQTCIGMVPRLQGLGGMVSFQGKLTAGLAARGIEVTFDLADPRCAAILVIGGTRQLVDLWRAQQRGVRIVQRLNGMNWMHRVRFPGMRGFLRAEINNRLLAFIRRRLAARIVYQSKFSKQWWDRVFGPASNPSSVVSNGIDLNSYTPDGPHQRPDQSFRLLLVEGHLGGEYQMGLENAVHLTEALQKRVQRPVELAVVGDVPENLRMLWQDRAGGAINWVGVLHRDQIPGMDRSAHILFSADLNAACPNSVVEALACGLPVAAFDTGALGELVSGGAGMVVPYGSNYWQLESPSIEPLADAAAVILSQQDRYRQSARQQAVSNFGLDRMVDGYLEALLGES